ncbi:magnesium and cobalt transport protein CorA [Kineococcus sp. NBC_00420]|uniref:magnesium and cobalt transport protein CorA n=1 Tax=unclassified Kineococcus TaxID=2621656 RepID=UPI002E1B9A2A
MARAHRHPTDDATRHAPEAGASLAALPVVACKLYRPGTAPQVVHDVTQALQQAQSSGGFVWIGLNAASAADVHRLTSIFDLPALAVEDAVNAHQRPKFERYGGQSFAVLKPVRYVDHDEVVDVSEIALFLGRNFVVTVRHGDSTVVADVRADVDLLASEPVGPASVLYRLVDRVVDGYLDAVDGIAVDVEDIEERVFGGADDEHAERIYKLKREVLEFKRAVVPLCAPLQRLVEGEAFVPGEVPGHEEQRQRSATYRDVLDHLLRAADAIDGYDRLLTDVLQAHLAQVSVRQSRVAAQQNEDMRRISAWAAIALVPTAIAGIYGMNFDNMPELSTRYGYFVVLAVIVSICTALYAVLKAKKWL